MPYINTVSSCIFRIKKTYGFYIRAVYKETDNENDEVIAWEERKIVVLK